ncbi:MAG TPA: NUDIX domain-containing protein [Pseudonocardiaceae bacterium]|jgi:8-oxo-dGTP pyrophosphatase MutT (NUDIX family)|nr:NUDIX domain-containing protein [Pseudonocardiaceae bacterium]
MKELVDYVDSDDNPVSHGSRGEAAARGLYYRVSATICTDRSGKVLVYRRLPGAAVYPDHYDVLVGGSVRAGETYLDAATRELAEELGIRTDVREVFRSRQDSPIGPCWLAVHQASIDGPLQVDHLEIAWCSFVTQDQVLDGVLQPFVPAGREALKRLLG